MRITADNKQRFYSFGVNNKQFGNRKRSLHLFPDAPQTLIDAHVSKRKKRDET